MTLTDDTAAKLREVAEKATPGPWHPGHLGSDSTCQCRSIVDEGGYMGAIATVHVDNGLPVGEGGNDAPPADEAAANMRYIAAFNPQTALALLDHLAAEKARADAAEAERDALKLAQRDVLDASQSTISTLTAERDALIRERDEARAALGELVDAAADYYDEASGYFSDTEYDRNGVLAMADAKLAVSALPDARAVLARTGEPKDE